MIKVSFRLPFVKKAPSVKRGMKKLFQMKFLPPTPIKMYDPRMFIPVCIKISY